MSSTQDPRPRAALFTLLTTLVLVSPALAAKPRLADEDVKRATRPVPADVLPQGWTLGQPIRFPRQLLPLMMGEMGEHEGGIAEPDAEPASVLLGLGMDPSHPRAATFGANRIANDPSADRAGATQSENSIAAHGRFLAAGWNDSEDPSGTNSFSGFGYSSDGGRTWHDGGILTHASANDQFFGDPCLTVDEDGNFYYASLYTNPNITLGVSVSRGRFVNDKLSFEPAVLAGVPNADDSFDKEWITVDRKDGTLYVSYTRFFDAGGDQIEVIRSRDHGRTWSAPVVVSDPATESVQGSRPVVGKDHDVFVIYTVTDLTDFNSHMRIHKSDDRGRSFGRGVNVGESATDVSIYPNFGNGPPGFNRAGGVEFPSIAAKTSEGHGSDQLYVTWNEAVDFFDDLLGLGGVREETENNNLPTTANPILMGETVVGNLDSATDQDWFSFTGHAGETVEFFLTPPQGARSNGFLRLFGPGGGTPDRLALSSFGGGQGFIVFTLPSDGTYFIRPALLGGSQSKPGPYLLFTGDHVQNPRDVAMDARDVMLTRSRDGVHWSRRTRVNDDAPRYDNAFAEVAVDRGGDVHLVWYDHRGDAQGGITTDLYHARSSDGGRTFAANQRVNDALPVNWNLIPSRLAPNMGDYIALTADGDNVYTVWADGRLGSPDSWMMQLAGTRSGHGDGDGDDDQPSLLAGGNVEDARVAPSLALALRVTNPSRAGAPLAMSFDVPRAGDVQLEIFSVTGQRVRSVFAGAVAAGTQHLTWDARGRGGERVAPGLYFAVLRSGSEQVRQRIVLLR